MRDRGYERRRKMVEGLQYCLIALVTILTFGVPIWIVAHFVTKFW